MQMNKKSSAKTYYPPWFTKTIISSIKEKHRLWNLYRKSKLLTYLDRIRILKCDIRRNIRQAYKVFISEAENSLHNDPKKFWSFVNKRRKTTCVPSCMTAGDGVIISNPQDIVNAFASQFASVYTNDNHKPCVASSCNKINCEYCGSCRCSLVSDNPICDNSICDNSVCDNNLIFNLPVINDCDILKAAKKIKPNFVCGPDDIPAFLVIDCLQYLLKPLCHIYNLILKSSIYPQMWKVSRVFPVFKAGDKANIVNYRPIALISNYAKLFECIMSDFLYTHCISKIALEQHGFIKGRSTVTNLCEFTEYVSLPLDNRFQVDAIYTDLSKAFDRVDHCILLKKLDTLGICHQLVMIFRNLLFGREQFVEIHGVQSTLFPVNSGVTQGSNLGPLLFTVFFNDVLNVISCRAFIYADDLKIAKVIKTNRDCLV